MRIGLFCDTFTPFNSGVVTAVVLLRKGLELLGHQVYLFAPSYRGFTEVDNSIYRFPSVQLLGWQRMPMAIPLSPRLTKMIPQLGLDVIHSHHPFVMGLCAAYFARRLQVPLIYSFHTDYPRYAEYLRRGRLVTHLVRSLLLAYADQCDALICHTEAMRGTLRAYGVRKLVEVVPVGIDYENFARLQQGQRALLKIGPKDQVVVYCGRLSPEKNLEMLLRAVARLDASLPRLRLMLVGKGTEEFRLRSLANELGVGSRVFFVGAVPYSEVPQYLGSADVFALPAAMEAKSLALLEAMAAGLPVVAVRSPGSEDTVTPGVNGVLTANDEIQFAEALASLLMADRTRVEMGGHARQTAQHYSFVTSAQRTEEVYRKARFRFTTL